MFVVCSCAVRPIISCRAKFRSTAMSQYRHGWNDQTISAVQRFPALTSGKGDALRLNGGSLSPQATLLGVRRLCNERSCRHLSVALATTPVSEPRNFSAMHADRGLQRICRCRCIRGLIHSGTRASLLLGSWSGLFNMTNRRLVGRGMLYLLCTSSLTGASRLWPALPRVTPRMMRSAV